MSAPWKGPVWMLWLQGWDKAPPICRETRKSWERNNPGWEIRALDRFSPEIGDISRIGWPAAASDMIRLRLLAEHGGVWTDATCACLRPLDQWLPAYMEEADFWMYHGRDGGAGPCSWFMCSKAGSYIAKGWRAEAEKYWSGGPVNPDEYFWMDGLFKKLMGEDPVFAEEWRRVPYLWCEDPGSSHMLAGKVDRDDLELQEILRTNPPHVVKLSHWHEMGRNARVALGLE